jgi:hypothetical protein
VTRDNASQGATGGRGQERPARTSSGMGLRFRRTSHGYALICVMVIFPENMGFRRRASQPSHFSGLILMFLNQHGEP